MWLTPGVDLDLVAIVEGAPVPGEVHVAIRHHREARRCGGLDRWGGPRGTLRGQLHGQQCRRCGCNDGGGGGGKNDDTTPAVPALQVVDVCRDAGEQGCGLVKYGDRSGGISLGLSRFLFRGGEGFVQVVDLQGVLGLLALAVDLVARLFHGDVI